MRRPFLGSILGLPAVAETICSRAEGTVTGAPVLGQRLGRAQHHRVVAAVTVRRRQQIAENSINVHLPLELAWLTVHRPPAGRALNLWLGACMRIDPCARAVEPCAVEPCTSFE